MSLAVSVLRDVLAEMGADIQDASTAEQKAVAVAAAMLRLEEHKEAASAARVVLAMAAWRQGYWAKHPAAPRRFRDFVALGFRNPRASASQISTIASFCEHVVHACDMWGIDIDAYVSRWDMLQEAVPALKRAIADGPEAIRAILDTLSSCTDRDQARALLRQRRRVGNGVYTVSVLGNAVFAAIVAAPEELNRLQAALGKLGYEPDGLVVSPTSSGFQVFVVEGIQLRTES